MTILLGNIGQALTAGLALDATKLRAKCNESATNDCTDNDNFVMTKKTASDCSQDRLQIGNTPNLVSKTSGRRSAGIAGPRIVGMIPDMENLPADYRLSPQPSLRRPRGSAQYYVAVPATLCTRTQSQGKSLG
jgi:hypothetical protein